MKLFHFSDCPDLVLFEPRPVVVPAKRAPGREWLNGPLVWATDDWHSILYLFPRDCPRIVIWPKADTSQDDRKKWFDGRPCRAIALVERTWLERVAAAAIYRYDMPTTTFEDLGDTGMWVSRVPVSAALPTLLVDLPSQLALYGVELRVLGSLAPLRGIWNSTLHASGIRLRNAQEWN